MPGEIHGLIGENGAGKSTLIEDLQRCTAPDEGEMMLRGEVVRFRSPADAKAAGIGMIYQELSLMPALSVAENVFLGRQPRNTVGLVDWKRMRAEAAAAAHGFRDRSRCRPSGSTSFRWAISSSSRSPGDHSGAEIIVLDEPTSALSGPESERLSV